MNDQIKQAQVQASIQQVKQQIHATEANVIAANPYNELLENLEQLLRSNGRIELVRNSDGTIDVRSGGVATYAHNLRYALRNRIDLEAARVTDKIMGGQVAGAGAIGGGGKIGL